MRTPVAPIVTLCTLLVGLVVGVAAPAPAHAATWRSCQITGNSGFTDGPYAVGVFQRLKARAPMSCSSARWVLNQWVRRAYARTGALEPRFYDGYVTWRGRLRGERPTGSGATIVEYHERTSGTAFRFDFYEYSD